MPENLYNILIIDDDTNEDAILQTVLEKEGYLVEMVFEGKIGLKHFNFKKYNLVILDVLLPDMSGFDVCREIRNTNPMVPIMFLTALDDLENKIKGFDVGADDYLVKPFEIPELLARIKSLLRRGSNSSTNPPEDEYQILKYADLELHLASGQARRQGRIIDLTQKEFQLLELFMRHPNRLISKSEIAENVWEINFDRGTNIIEVYVNYLRNKIDKPFDRQLIHTIKGMGYIMRLE